MRKIALTLVISLLMSNCATMLHGTNETINIRSEEQDTRFYVNQREIGQGTSAVASIPKKQLQQSTLIATKTGCREKIISIETKFDPTTLLGLLIDYGIVSILIVDSLTGAILQAEQTNYLLTPECTQDMPKNTFPSKFRKSLDLLREGGME